MNTGLAIAVEILDGFDKHYRLFRETSAHAKVRWERADWSAAREAQKDRIAMYDQRVRECVAQILEKFQGISDLAVWPEIKLSYFQLLYEHKQPECAETFFNSVARRLLARRYYENEILFRRPALSTEHLDGKEPTYSSYYLHGDEDLRDVFKRVIESFRLAVSFASLARDADLLARAVKEEFPASFTPQPNFQIQVLSSLFFRNKAAYIVGRVLNGDATIPIVVPLLRDESGGAYVDALLVSEVDVGRLMSVGRAYFMVDMEVPSAYVDFLSSLVPNKPRAELYTLLGLQKQGKTIFFRDLERHILHSSDAFVLAPGTRGMVMLVFTLPSFPYVFKVIRDWFSPPKDADRKHVMERYDFVKLHDRVGRMADTLEFAHVAFPKERFAPALTDELERLAPSCMERRQNSIVIDHLYVERRLVPLDMYLHGADEAKLRAGILEFGNAVKDLARADLFPGDVLLKNFGVTRFGRVVFYDYDELTTLQTCNFRTMPKARDDEEEWASEPQYFVDPRDIFPEQFPRFLFAEGRAREIFMELHGDLATAKYWQNEQERRKAGLIDDLFPYPEPQRFSRRFGRA